MFGSSPQFCQRTLSISAFAEKASDRFVFGLLCHIVPLFVIVRNGQPNAQPLFVSVWFANSLLLLTLEPDKSSNNEDDDGNAHHTCLL